MTALGSGLTFSFRDTKLDFVRCDQALGFSNQPTVSRYQYSLTMKNKAFRSAMANLLELSVIQTAHCSTRAVGLPPLF